MQSRLAWLIAGFAGRTQQSAVSAVCKSTLAVHLCVVILCRNKSVRDSAESDASGCARQRRGLL